MDTTIDLLVDQSNLLRANYIEKYPLRITILYQTPDPATSVATQRLVNASMFAYKYGRICVLLILLAIYAYSIFYFPCQEWDLLLAHDHHHHHSVGPWETVFWLLHEAVRDSWATVFTQLHAATGLVEIPGLRDTTGLMGDSFSAGV